MTTPNQDKRREKLIDAVELAVLLEFGASARRSLPDRVKDISSAAIAAYEKFMQPEGGE